MIDRRTALGALAAGLLGAAAPLRAQAAAAFEFVALGDMPYGPDPVAGPAYRHLIGLINQVAPPFSIHVGDFKNGTAACGDDEYLRQWRHFQRFDAALVYTPGDNDWLDCQRRGDDPLERLRSLRERFFARPHSLGRRPIAVQRQADLMPAFARYRENQRWVHQGVLFATVHTVGQRNGSDAAQPQVRDEARWREAANAAWIDAAFAQARNSGARALVLATQAETLHYPDPEHPRRGVVRDVYASIGQHLLPLAAAAPFPVLLIHGDAHQYVTDQPFHDAGGRPIANLWRLEVFGAPRLHAVRVRVQPGLPGEPPFSFAPVWNPMSADPRARPDTGS